MHVRGEAKHLLFVTVGQGGHLRAELFVFAANHDDLQRTFDAIEFAENLTHRSHAEAATEHEHGRHVGLKTKLRAQAIRIHARGEFCGDGNACYRHVRVLRAACYETRLGPRRSHAEQIHTRLHPQRVRFKVRHDAGDEGLQLRSVTLLVHHAAHDFQRQVMRRENHVGRELDHFLHKLLRHHARRLAAELRQLFDARGIIRLLEHHRVEVGRVLDELQVALHVNFPVPARCVIEHVHAAHVIARSQRAPRFFKGRGSLEMTRTGRHRRNENSHVGKVPEILRACPISCIRPSFGAASRIETT